MFDMLVRLYDLPDHSALVGRLRDSGVEIRRALPPETPVIRRFVERNFSAAWASECDRAIQNWPVSCYLALEGGRILGFACYDATCRGFFGPTAVLERARGRGIGKALLWCALRGMAEYGYAYAVIGGVGPDKFYADAVGAVPVAGSDPGIFRGVLLRDPEERDDELELGKPDIAGLRGSREKIRRGVPRSPRGRRAARGSSGAGN